MIAMLHLFTFLTVMLLVVPSPVAAQINVPNIFTPQTRILSSEVNANFATLGADALNRTGGTMTGTLTTQLLIPDGNNTRALGASGTRWSTVFGVAGNYSGAVTITDTTAGSLDIGGGLNAGTGNVAIIGADGRIPAISSTQFASLSGANLTGILETGIADGSVLARVAANETISGTWTFSSADTVSNGIRFTGIGAAAAGKIGLNANQLVFLGGSSGHAFYNSGGGLLTSVDVSGNWSMSGALTVTGAVAVAGPTTYSSTSSVSLSADVNDWNPAGLSTAAVLLVDASGGDQNHNISGLLAQATGRQIKLCSSGSVGTLNVLPEDALSSADNRFAPSVAIQIVRGLCKDIWRDGVSGRWRVDQ